MFAISLPAQDSQVWVRVEKIFDVIEVEWKYGPPVGKALNSGLFEADIYGRVARESVGSRVSFYCGKLTHIGGMCGGT